MHAHTYVQIINLIWTPSEKTLFPFKLKRILIGCWWFRPCRIPVEYNMYVRSTVAYSFMCLPFSPLWVPPWSGCWEWGEELYDNSIVSPLEKLFSNFDWLSESPGHLVKIRRPGPPPLTSLSSAFFIFLSRWPWYTMRFENHGSRRTELLFILCLLLLQNAIFPPFGLFWGKNITSVNT